MTFDDKAKEWDNNPLHINRARIVADAIRQYLKPDGTKRAFEFGCGTGLLSYFLREDFMSIAMTDTSQGMLKVLEEKIVREKITNFSLLLFDLSKDEYPYAERKFDVINTSMTLHHIDDVGAILRKFYSMLNEGGYLCIADLDKEDGRFHAADMDFKGHKGFDRNEIEMLLKQNNFEPCYYKICLEIEKIFENNEVKKYPVFLLIAKKK